MSFFNFSSSGHGGRVDGTTDDGYNDEGMRRVKKMTHRSPSSASSSSRSSLSSSTSALSNVSSTSSSSSWHECGGWNRSINIREIYKTSKLTQLNQRKPNIFKRSENRWLECSFWCVLCIHEECDAFLELYEDHKSSLTHQPSTVIPLTNCQHVSPNIHPPHSFTLTLTNTSHQFAAESDAEMTDWIATIKNKLTELQQTNQLNVDKHEYTRCPNVLQSPVSRRSISPISELVDSGENQVVPRLDKRPPPRLDLTKSQKDSPSLGSPPACLAPPVPSQAPPIPPRTKLMRPAPHPLLNSQIPPPPPPRLIEQTLVRREEQLINLEEETQDTNVYGTLFLARKAQLAIPDTKRETRSATASPTFSEKSNSSTLSEPTTPKPFMSKAVSNCTPANDATATLRQQQVHRLRAQMLDPHGVNVKIRRSHCVDSIAFLDCFGSVWIGGWKQSEHPYLHTLLHLGDQLVSVNGIFVSKAADVQRILRETLANKYLVFNLNRVPRGNILLIKRQFEGQDLGWTRDSATTPAEIRTVLPDGLAAASGLTTKALTCDGNNLCNWVLTEINHRPLNWFFKDSEIEDRLKAVGKEMSVMVQPGDLVAALKKQLKSLRGFKDFIVQ